MSVKNIFDGVEDTLYIPLIARIYVSERFPEFFYDDKALSLKQYIAEDYIKNNSNEYFNMASVCRQYVIDKKVIEFIKNHSKSNIVFLGSGLETAYNRIGNTNDNFYHIDLPNVIEQRKSLLGNAENEVLIAEDMFSLDWVKKIDLSLPTIITVSGVYQYFDESKIVAMINKMRTLIPKGELVFDATNSKGLKYANKYVQKTGNKNACMYFCVDNINRFVDITGTKLISVNGFYDEALKYCKGLNIKTIIYMFFADRLSRTMVIHLSLNQL